MSSTENKRIYYIDFLKVIGLTGIIAAHVQSPGWVMMFRNFDVVLMVILSSMLARYSYKKSGSDIKYIISRAKRLVIPTWIFLVIFFILHLFVFKDFLGFKYYIYSFLLTRYGIGYVWIILIYLYSALLIPLFAKMGYSRKNTIVIFIIYLIYEVFCYFKIGMSYKLVDSTFYYIIPYGVLTYLGYNYIEIDDEDRYATFWAAFDIFLLFAVYYYSKFGVFKPVQIAKYPVRFYYLAYGVFCSLGLLLYFGNRSFNFYKSHLVQFISMHSMWIYLWHILVLTMYQVLHLPEIWYVKLIIVYILSMIIVLLVNKLLDIVEERWSFSFIKYLRG